MFNNRTFPEPYALPSYICHFLINFLIRSEETKSPSLKINIMESPSTGKKSNCVQMGKKQKNFQRGRALLRSRKYLEVSVLSSDDDSDNTPKSGSRAGSVSIKKDSDENQSGKDKSPIKAKSETFSFPIFCDDVANSDLNQSVQSIRALSGIYSQEELEKAFDENNSKGRVRKKSKGISIDSTESEKSSKNRSNMANVENINNVYDNDNIKKTKILGSVVQKRDNINIDKDIDESAESDINSHSPIVKTPTIINNQIFQEMGSPQILELDLVPEKKIDKKMTNIRR